MSAAPAPEPEVDRVRGLLAGTNPVPERVLADAQHRPVARAALARILLTPRDPASVDPRLLPVPVVDPVLPSARQRGPRPDGGPSRRRPRRTSFLAGAAAVAATLLVATTAVLAPWHSGDAVAATPPLLEFDLVVDRDFVRATGRPAAPSLYALAQTAAARAEPAQDGEREYLSADRWTYAGTFDAADPDVEVVASRTETWVSPDGSLVRSTRAGLPVRVDGRLGADDTALTDAVATSESFGAGSAALPRASELAALPADELRAALLAETTCGVVPEAACLLEAVARLHDTMLVPGTVDAAVWSLLATEPDLVTLGAVTDRVDRTAIAFTASPALGLGVRWVLLLDPRTGALLGAEKIVLSDTEGYGVPVPAVVAFTAYRTSAWVP